MNTKGEVTDVKILRSLDATFGLDQEAIKTARQWRFSPGTRLGEPVPVVNLNRIELHSPLTARPLVRRSIEYTKAVKP